MASRVNCDTKRDVRGNAALNNSVLSVIRKIKGRINPDFKKPRSVSEDCDHLNPDHTTPMQFPASSGAIRFSLNSKQNKTKTKNEQTKMQKTKQKTQGHFPFKYHI